MQKIQIFAIQKIIIPFKLFYFPFFHKAPQPPKSVPLSPAYHSDPFWPHVPIFPIALLQFSNASTVLLSGEAEISASRTLCLIPLGLCDL